MSQNISSIEKTQLAHNMHRANASLKAWFEQVYAWHIQQFPKTGSRFVVELGSGGSDLKKYYEQVMTTDILELPHIDMVVDAVQMPFENNSVDAFTMVNVLHHLNDPLKFFKEVARTLKPGGKLVMTEPFVSLVSYPVYKWIHHEPCELNKNIWSLPPGDPLFMSNQAIPSEVLFKQWNIVTQACPDLVKTNILHHSSLSYFLTGGVSRKTLLPLGIWKFINQIDKALCKFLGKSISSFISVSIEKK